MTARTLVLDGERSDAYLRSAAASLAKMLPRAKRQTIAGQDHSAVFMAPQSLAPAIKGFLRGSGPRVLTRPSVRGE